MPDFSCPTIFDDYFIDARKAGMVALCPINNDTKVELLSAT